MEDGQQQPDAVQAEKGEGKAGGGSGGGGLGRIMEPMVNEVHFHDDGWTAISSRNIFIPSNTRPLAPYDSFKITEESNDIYMTDTNWLLLDWNSLQGIMGPREWHKVFNEYEEWSPTEWAVQMSGIKITTQQTIQSTTNATVDLTGALEIAVRDKGTIPFMGWGIYKDSTNVELLHPWADEPWKPCQFYNYRYFSGTIFAGTQKLQTGYAVEKGVVENYTSVDVFTAGGSFGQASSIHNMHMNHHVLDPFFYLAADTAEWDKVVTTKDRTGHFLPSTNNPATKLYYNLEGSKAHAEQYRAGTGPLTNADTPNSAYNREHGLDSWSKGVHTTTTTEEPTAPWGEVQGNLQKWTGAFRTAPIYTPTPYGATAHRAIGPTHVVTNCPPMILMRIKPTFTTNVDTTLTQTGQAMVTVVVKFKGRKIAQPLGRLEPQRYFTADDALGGTGIEANMYYPIGQGQLTSRRFNPPNLNNSGEFAFGAEKLLF